MSVTLCLLWPARNLSGHSIKRSASLFLALPPLRASGAHLTRGGKKRKDFEYRSSEFSRDLCSPGWDSVEVPTWNKGRETYHLRPVTMAEVDGNLASGGSNKDPKVSSMHSRVPSSGPSERATFTTSLSVPVIGTRAVTSSSNSTQSTNDAINSASGNHNASTGVVPSGPAPTRMASSRMATNTHTQTQTSTSIDDGFREGGKPPDLGLEPIKVASVLDLNSVRTQAPRPPASSQGSALPGQHEQRPFGLEDCPTFYPTTEEWHDPTAYIRKIAPSAERSGLCKIIPPEGWRMPFVTNTEVRLSFPPAWLSY